MFSKALLTGCKFDFFAIFSYTVDKERSLGTSARTGGGAEASFFILIHIPRPAIFDYRATQ